MSESIPAALPSKVTKRIELRCVNGPLLAVLYVTPLLLEVRRNGRLFEVDLQATLSTGDAVIVERVQSKEGP